MMSLYQKDMCVIFRFCMSIVIEPLWGANPHLYETKKYKKKEGDKMTAWKAMLDYMTKHNYNISDYPTYSLDPEWQQLNEALIRAMAEENRT